MDEDFFTENEVVPTIVESRSGTSTFYLSIGDGGVD